MITSAPAEPPKTASFAVESGRGVECPFCGDTDFNSRKIKVNAVNSILIITEKCSSCLKKWNEVIRLFVRQRPNLRSRIRAIKMLFLLYYISGYWDFSSFKMAWEDG